jgi:hypothetical protein
VEEVPVDNVDEDEDEDDEEADVVEDVPADEVDEEDEEDEAVEEELVEAVVVLIEVWDVVEVVAGVVLGVCSNEYMASDYAGLSLTVLGVVLAVVLAVCRLSVHRFTYLQTRPYRAWCCTWDGGRARGLLQSVWCPGHPGDLVLPFWGLWTQ